jgi:hypothetical protein
MFYVCSLVNVANPAGDFQPSSYTIGIRKLYKDFVNNQSLPWVFQIAS